MAYGNYNKALKIVEGGDDAEFQELFLDWLRVSFKLDPLQLQNWLQRFMKFDREQQKFFIDYSLAFLRTLHLMNFLPREKIRFTDREYNMALNVLKLVTQERVISLQEVIEETSRHLERNANAKILLTERSIQIHDILRS
jgi:DNA polymerase-3 subunit delta'